MKPVAAFAAGLWTGAVAVLAIAVFYLRLGEPGLHETKFTDRREQSAQQDLARAQAEEARLKETIADLQAKLELQKTLEARRQLRSLQRRAAEVEPEPEVWMIEAVVKGDAQALPRLERTALESNPFALDALALLAEHDGGEALSRVWSSGRLTLAARQRATYLLAATAELNPRAEELLQTIFTAPPSDPLLRDAALTGILSPDFSTRLKQSEDFPAPPHFRPDYAYRLRLVDGWRAVVTNEQLLARIDLVREKLAPQ